MGVGHVPAGTFRIVGQGGHLQGRQHRGAPGEGGLLTDGVGSDRRRSVGTAGEDRAAAWYHEHGYRVVDRNWRSRQGEIDLVAAKTGVLVFCEVKTRNTTAFGMPFEAVTRAKQLRLRRLAAEWLRCHPAERWPDLRFDVVSVLGPRLEVLEGAF